MLSAVNLLFSELLGVIFPAWLNCEAVQYVIGILLFAIVGRFVFSFFHCRRY